MNNIFFHKSNSYRGKGYSCRLFNNIIGIDLAIVLLSAAVCALMISCHSQKAVSSVDTEKTLLANTRNEVLQSVKTDSTLHSLAVSFDTLDVWVEDLFVVNNDLSSYAYNKSDSTNLYSNSFKKRNVHLRGIRADFNSQLKSTASDNSISVVSDSSSVAHAANSELNTENSQTAVYRPPNLTWIICIVLVLALLAIGVFIYYKVKRKNG
jgi:hypothetical protein